MKRFRRTNTLLICCSLIWLAGCGGGGETGTQFDKISTVPVSGTATLDGSPVAEGMIIEFLPGGGGKEGSVRTASGPVGSEGSFSLGTYDDADGAAPGEYSVILSSSNLENPAPAIQPLTVTVPADGTPDLKVELKKAEDDIGGGDLLSPKLN